MRRLTAVHWLLGAYVAGLCLSLAWRPSAVALLVGFGLPAAAAIVAASPLAAQSWLSPQSHLLRAGPLLAMALVFAIAGVAVGGWRLDKIAQSRLQQLVGQRAPLAATVVDLPTVKGENLTVPVRVTAFGHEQLDEPVHLSLKINKGDVPPLDPCGRLVEGVRITLAASAIEALPTAKPGQFDYGRYLARRGEHAMVHASLSDLRYVGRRGGLSGLVDRLRVAARAHLRRGLGPPVRDVLAGMVLGDDEYVPASVVDDMRRSGLLHILAVSGENVVLLCAMWGFLLSLARVRRSLRLLVLMPLIIAYTVLTGASPSIVRAGVAGVVGLLAALLSRPSDGWLLWLVPAAWLLTVSPNAIYDVSFQLTFAAVAGLLLLSRSFTDLFGFLPRSVAEAVGVTAAASVATAPISIFTFGSTSLVGIPANVVGAFILGPVMFLGMLSVMIGFVLAPLCLPLNLLAGVCTGFLLAVSSWFSHLPGAVYQWRGLTLGTALFVALAVGLFILWRLAQRRGERLLSYVGCTRRRTHVVLVAVLVVGLIVVVTPAAPAAPRLPALTFLNVGEGAAALVQAPGGPTVLIDAGPAPIAAILRAHGVRRIDVLVLSHGHADHTAGLADVLGTIPVTIALVPRPPTPNPPLSKVMAELRTAAVPIRECTEPLLFQGGSYQVAVLPTTAAHSGADSNQDENNCALVAVVTLAQQRVLIPGDAEGEALAKLNIGTVSVAEVPHHGSRGGFDARLLASLAPRLTVISVGPNTYGHPTTEMLTLLGGRHLPCLRTDRAGDVTLTARREGLAVSIQRR
ncbi:MAG: ComEC/Rec2 family competence protein [Thermoleophilia bacterium]